MSLFLLNTVVLVIIGLLSLGFGILAFNKRRYMKGSLFLLPAFLLFVVFILPPLLVTRADGRFENCIRGLRGAQTALELYNTHYKYYPEKLEVLISEGYLQEKGDIDPWSTPYKYERTSDKSNYLIGSAGEDKLFDTKDDVEPPINTKRHTFKTSVEVKR